MLADRDLDPRSWRVEPRASLGDEAEVWDGMVAAMALPSPFLRSWWLGAVRTPDTRFLLVRDAQGRLRGGLPVDQRRRWGVSVVRFAGAGPLCPDHLDVVAEPADAPAVAVALDAWWRARKPVAMELDGLVQEAAAAALWGPGEANDVAPYLNLAEQPGFPERLSASRRRSVRRTRKSLEQHGFVHSVVGAHRLDDALRRFRALQTERPDRDRLLSVLGRLEAAVRAGHARGEVRIDVLGEPADAAAVSIAFAVEGRVSLYQVARSLAPEAAGAGNAAIHAVAEVASTQGFVEVDLLRGDEEYKQSLADARRSLWRVRRGFGIRGRLLVLAWEVGTVLRRGVGRGVGHGVGRRVVGALSAWRRSPAGPGA